CFDDADAVVVADVYAAGEQRIEGVDRDALVNALKAHGHRHALALPSPDDLPKIIGELASSGDYVVFLGAGDITQWAYALPEQLRRVASSP
ncbi:MAG: UDP-N-acetylmuramate--L-alanine ligase, partial [Methylocystaceae bacterium]